jgi:hypothetical protein
MNKSLLILAALVLFEAGCTTMGFNPGKALEDPGAQKSTAAAAPQRPPAVFPDQVNDSNAHDKALALSAELDFDMQYDQSHPAGSAAH